MPPKPCGYGPNSSCARGCTRSRRRFNARTSATASNWWGYLRSSCSWCAWKEANLRPSDSKWRGDDEPSLRSSRIRSSFRSESGRILTTALNPVGETPSPKSNAIISRPFPFQHPQLGDRWARRTRWQGFPGLGDVHDEAIIVPVERPTAAPPFQLIRIVRSASLCPPARPQVVADVVRPQRGPADRS